MQTSKLRLYATTSAEDEAEGLSLNGAIIKRPDGTIARHVKPFGDVDIVLTDDMRHLVQALYVVNGNYYRLTHIVGSIVHAVKILQKSISERLKQLEQAVDSVLVHAQMRDLDNIKSELDAIIDTLTVAEDLPQQKAQDSLLAQMSTLFKYLRSVNNYYERIQKDLSDDSVRHIDILRQFFLLSTIKARLYFLLGKPSQAISVIKESSENITSQATRLLQRWTADVKLTLPDKNSGDRLFEDMFKIDGVLPFNRLYQSNQAMPQIPPKLQRIALRFTKYTKDEPKNAIIPEHGLHVISGNIIRFYSYRNQFDYFIVNDSGYLIKNNDSYNKDDPSDYDLILTRQIPPISLNVVENIHRLAEVVNDARVAASEVELTQRIKEIAVSIPLLVHGPQAEPDTMLLLTAQENVSSAPQQEKNIGT